MIIQTQSYPRADLIGNPSDGYYGKTIAFVFKNFSANVQLYHTPELEIITTSLKEGLRKFAEWYKSYYSKTNQ